MWNIQQAGCVAQMDLPGNTEGNPYIVFDSTGMVFSVMAEMAGKQGFYIHLYDARNFQGGAFSEMQVPRKSLEDAITTHRVTPPTEHLIMNSITFNSSGNRILVQSEQGLAFVLDGYEGTVQRVFESSRGKGTVSCFTPDDQSVLMGSESGIIDCWNIQSGTVVKQLEGHVGPVGAIACNPKFKQIASSCTNTW
jgi:WD40 repeat protein